MDKTQLGMDDVISFPFPPLLSLPRDPNLSAVCVFPTPQVPFRLLLQRP